MTRTEQSAKSRAPSRLSFRLRIIGPAALIAVPLMAVAGWRAWDRQNAEMRALESEAREQVTVAEAELNGQLASVQGLLAGVARMANPTAPAKEAEALLRDLMRAGPLQIANLWMVNREGRVVAAVRSPETGASALDPVLGPVSMAAITTRRVAMGDAIRAIEFEGAPWSLTVAVPIAKSGEPQVLGALGATLIADSLDAVSLIRRLPAGSVLTLQDSLGGIVWRSLDADNWVGRQFGTTQGFRDVRMLGRGVDFTRSADGTVRQVAYRVMPSTGWVVYVGIPDALTRQIVREQLLWDLAFVVIATIALLGVAWFVADQVAGPIVADALARESAERALAESREQLRQAQKMDALGSFAGGIAHDFNNYLSSIIGFSEMALAEVPASHPAHADMQQVLSAAERASRLTRQILVFSRRTPVEPQALDVANVVEGLQSLLRSVVGDRVEVSMRVQRDAGMVRADKSQLEQVLVNLATNARDAMPDGGRLEVFVLRERFPDIPSENTPPGDYVTLRVRDTGTGMSDDIRERIFEPFFTTKEPGRGTGLGLALVYSMVQQAKGIIRVASAPGDGTTFTLRFRRLATGEISAAVVPPKTATFRGAGQHIVVTEDDADVRRMTVQLLTRAGYRVTAASGGTEALACIGDGAGVDLLLTDVVMPGLHGRALLDDVWRAAPALRVLVMSGHPDDDALVQDIREAAIPFLPKPFSGDALLAAVHHVLTAPLSRPSSSPGV